MQLWLIPMVYVAGSVIGGLVLPRLEQAYFPFFTLNVSIASAQAFLAAVASGMMALMSIVFAMAFVMVQFSAIAYSPRLVVWLARDPSLFHSLGAFAATFVYALVTLVWVDRNGSGSVPLLSGVMVTVMLVASLLLFSRLVQRLSDLQIASVLGVIGDKGRAVIKAMFPRGAAQNASYRESADEPQLGRPTQSLRYAGAPRTISKFEIGQLVELARSVNGVIALNCAVGDTLADGTPLLRVYSATAELPDKGLRQAIQLRRERTFEQDPKYPIRLLVDVAIKALSPAINDPTTAVQAIDQIEDLLRRLGACDLNSGSATDAEGIVRVLFPMPTWDDYLSLAFDEIRQYGVTSVQVVRRLRAALLGIISGLTDTKRIDTARQYLKHLEMTIDRSSLDTADRLKAHVEDRQGLGLSRKPADFS